MSRAAADAFLERAAADDAFAAELDAIKDDATAVLAKARAAGYDVSEHEVHRALMERYGAELTPEELDRITAG
jgi:predicted ribosomally synthesized peptide with nif11-like leader